MIFSGWMDNCRLDTKYTRVGSERKQTRGAEMTNTKDKGKGVINRGVEEARTAAAPKMEETQKKVTNAAGFA